VTPSGTATRPHTAAADDTETIGIDVDQASKKLDLRSLEAESLPATRVRIS